MNVLDITRMVTRIDCEHGLIPAIIAFSLLMNYGDEGLLELARDYLAESDENLMNSPDWVRILANASSVEALEFARYDLLWDLKVKP